MSLPQVATAQTMKVYQGQVITAIPAATAADVVFAEGGGSFSVMGTTYPVTKVDRITLTIPPLRLAPFEWLTMMHRLGSPCRLTSHPI
ncbi:MAG: hypothetical protein ACLS29_01555 [Prevotellamassilia sp.]